MGFVTGLGFPTCLGRPYYYMQQGFVPPTGSACDCSSLHGCEESQTFDTNTIIEQSSASLSTCNTSLGTDKICSGGGAGDAKASWCVWFKTTDVTSSTLFSKGTMLGGVDKREYICYFDSSDKLVFRIYDESCNSGTNYIQQISNSALTSNIQDTEWHQCIIIYDGTEAASGISMYIDGSAVTSTGSETGTYDYSTKFATLPLVFGRDVMGTSGVALGGQFEGGMAQMAMWNTNISSGTVTDLWNGGNSYIYQVSPTEAWSGVSDLSYDTHYTDGGTGSNYCDRLIFYLPGCSYMSAVHPMISNFSCSQCSFIVDGEFEPSTTDWPGMWTPNFSVTGVTEKIRIWLQNNEDVATGEWSNQATGDTAVDAEQATSGNQAAVSGGGLDFDGTNDHYDFLDGSSALYDFDIAAQEGLTIMCVFDRDADADHTILSSGDDDHYIQVDSGSDTITIKLGSTATTITPNVNDMWANGTKVLMTLVRESGTTGNIKLYADGVLLYQVSQAANPGDGEFDTLGVRSTGTPNYFNGKIYELALWNKQLSTAELLEAHVYFKTIHSIA
tara:strand:+ start:729 stop:2402 length:1674 start_codon:yes stop_codon:yes gene_type:complete